MHRGSIAVDRVEVALRVAPSAESRRRRRLSQTLARYHVVNPEEPFMSMCGWPIDHTTAKPADNADFMCQSRACQRAWRRDG